MKVRFFGLLPSLAGLGLLMTPPSSAAPATEAQIKAKQAEINRLQAEIQALRSKPTTYKVKAGDTLSSIARRHKISPSQLASYNSISDPTKLAVGEVLSLQPSQAAGQGAAKLPAGKRSTYVVKKGDTFYNIAKRHQLTIAQLQALNPEVEVSHITLGQKLKVLGRPKPAAKAKKPRQASPPAKKPAVKPKAPSKPTPKPASKPIPKPAPVAKIEPAPEPKAEPKPAPPAPKPMIEPEEPASDPTPEPTPLPEPEIEAPTDHAIILTEDMSFEAFAKKHNTTVDKLNEINGWDLPAQTKLARGSEVYLPKN